MIIAVAGGLIIGMLVGALGGGGAILGVPLLVYGAGQDSQQATISSLVIVVSAALAGLVMQHRNGAVNYRTGLIFGVLGSVGALAGTLLNGKISEPLLLTCFSVLLVVVAVLTFLKARNSSSDANPETADGDEAGHELKNRLPMLVVTATGVGFLTGLFGVGGGFVIVPALTIVLGVSMRVAVGTSLVVIAINSVVTMAFRYQELSTIEWGTLWPIVVLTVLGALGGAFINKRVSQSALQLGFAVLLCGVAVFIAVQNVPELPVFN